MRVMGRIICGALKIYLCRGKKLHKVMKICTVWMNLPLWYVSYYSNKGLAQAIQEGLIHSVTRYIK